MKPWDLSYGTVCNTVAVANAAAVAACVVAVVVVGFLFKHSI